MHKLKINSKSKKLIAISALCLILIPVLSGCAFFENAEIEINQSTVGLPLQISTYDFNGQKIDEIKTSKAKIHTDRKMSEKSDGKENSSVIDIDYGSNRTIHVGSTLIAYEGIKNYADVYNHEHIKVNATQDKSVPIVTDIYKDFQNTWGKGYNGTVVFVKSQSGVPIGTFYGKNVSVHKSKIKNATNFVIDDHRLFCYRCEYTTYSLSALKTMFIKEKSKD